MSGGSGRLAGGPVRRRRRRLAAARATTAPATAAGEVRTTAGMTGGTSGASPSRASARRAALIPDHRPTMAATGG